MPNRDWLSPRSIDRRKLSPTRRPTRRTTPQCAARANVPPVDERRHPYPHLRGTRTRRTALMNLAPSGMSSRHSNLWSASCQRHPNSTMTQYRSDRYPSQTNGHAELEGAADGTRHADEAVVALPRTRRRSVHDSQNLSREPGEAGRGHVTGARDEDQGVTVRAAAAGTRGREAVSIIRILWSDFGASGHIRPAPLAGAINPGARPGNRVSQDSPDGISRIGGPGRDPGYPRLRPC